MRVKSQVHFPIKNVFFPSQLNCILYSGYVNTCYNHYYGSKCLIYADSWGFGLPHTGSRKMTIQSKQKLKGYSKKEKQEAQSLTHNTKRLHWLDSHPKPRPVHVSLTTFKCFNSVSDF